MEKLNRVKWLVHLERFYCIQSSLGMRYWATLDTEFVQYRLIMGVIIYGWAKFMEVTQVWNGLST